MARLQRSQVKVGLSTSSLLPMTDPEFSQEGDHRVRRITDDASGVVIHEAWENAARKLDRSDGPAEIGRSFLTGAVIQENWHRDGKFHRSGGPASIEREETTGVCTRELWYENGKLTRQNGPAFITRDSVSGALTHEIWIREGMPHRDDGPAEVWRCADSTVIREEWWIEGKMTKAVQYGPHMPDPRGIHDALLPVRIVA